MWLHDASGWNLSLCLSVCVCPSGMTPCSTPPALMDIWTVHTHTHLTAHTYPYEGTAEGNCPPFYPSSLLLGFSPPPLQSLRTHPGVHFRPPASLLFSLSFLFSLGFLLYPCIKIAGPLTFLTFSVTTNLGREQQRKEYNQLELCS